LQAGALAWGFAEATLFFVVPDVLLSYIAVRRGLREGLLACLLAALGASLGGTLMYLWSARDLANAQAAVLLVPAVNAEMLETAWQAMLAKGWFAATFEGPLTATPFKVYAILAPQVGAGLNAFALAAILARLPRFLIVTTGAGVLGRLLEPFVAQRKIMIGLAVIWLVFYAVYWLRVPW
jgi:hypothetical protein